MPQGNDTVSLNDALDAFKHEIMRDLNCVQIGQIESFDAGNQTATIRLVIKHVVSVANDGTRTLKERPLLVSCPVMVLSGGAGYLTMPIAKGDTCIVLFNDREMDNWSETGQPSAPNTNRMHDLSDGMAIVGIRNLQNALSGYATDGVVLGYGVNTLKVSAAGAVSSAQLTAPALHAGNGATGSYTIVNVVNGIVISGS